MKRSTFVTIIIFIVGVSLGWVFRGCTHTKDIERNTITDTTYYCIPKIYEKEELTSYKLDYPPLDIPKYSFFTEYQTIVKDSIQYVVLPRESRYLNKDNVEVWYSGVDPSIDRMVVNTQVKEITKVVEKPFKKNSISIYGEVGYNSRGVASVGLQYSYSPWRWLSFKTSAEWDFWGKQFAIKESMYLNVFSF